MPRLQQAIAFFRHHQVGPRETEMLCAVHLHVETIVINLAAALDISVQNANGLLGHLRRKGLIQEGKKWPRKKRIGIGEHPMQKSWRLTDKVRASMDHFEATGLILNPPKRRAAPAAGKSTKL